MHIFGYVFVAVVAAVVGFYIGRESHFRLTLQSITSYIDSLVKQGELEKAKIIEDVKEKVVKSV